MRNRTTTMALMLVLLVSTACVGRKTREKVLQPAVAQAWKGVKADIEVGFKDAKEAGDVDDATLAILNNRVAEFDAIIKAKDVVALLGARAAWPNLKTYALRGITRRVKDGEISAGVSQSLLERVNTFEEALFKLTDGG